MQHKTIESVLERGEKLNDLVDRSNALSAQSKMFYKTAKKVRAPPLCAPLLLTLPRAAKLVLRGDVGRVAGHTSGCATAAWGRGGPGTGRRRLALGPTAGAICLRAPATGLYYCNLEILRFVPGYTRFELRFGGCAAKPGWLLPRNVGRCGRRDPVDRVTPTHARSGNFSAPQR